jgi:hypothetical protein
MIRVIRHTKQRSLKYRIETALTRWAADVTHACLIWRKTKRIPAIVVKEAAIAFGTSFAFSFVTLIVIGVLLHI